ncbi:MAG: SDR family oxidoreductase, partial [Clostridiales bacterium]|nr:SDR family oxidoreductase [Clostridiales bacterium]
MGRCTARMLARAGANVLVSDMDGAEAEETVAQIKAESDVKALSMVCNVTSKADIDSAFTS